MADTPKNHDDPGADDEGPVAQELDDLELEKWTDAFDQLTGGDRPRPAEVAADADEAPATEAAAAAPAVPADVDRLFDEGGIEFGEALGDLLGAPPPLPLPDGSEEIMSSAPRPVRTSVPRMAPLVATAPASVDLPPAPTDDEIFGDAAKTDFGASLADD